MPMPESLTQMTTNPSPSPFISASLTLQFLSSRRMLLSTSSSLGDGTTLVGEPSVGSDLQVTRLGSDFRRFVARLDAQEPAPAPALALALALALAKAVLCAPCLWSTVTDT